MKLKKLIKIILASMILIPFLLLVYLIIINKLGISIDIKDSYIELPNGYRYVCASEHKCRISLKRYSKEEAFLPEKIIELAYDERYVIAKQYGMKLKYPDNLNNTYKVPNKDEIYYWILDTQEKVRYGPYDNITGFELKEIDFGISDLEFKNVNSYKKSYE